MEVSTSQGPELHLNLFLLQKHVLHWQVSTPQGPELHLEVSTIQRHVLLLEVSSPQGPELHVDLSALHTIVLLTEVSTTQGPELHLDVSHPKEKVPTYYRRCLVCFKNNLINVGRVHFALKIVFFLLNGFASL
jgi:hypothetical protein